MNKAGKEFAFDLDTNKLKENFGEKAYTKAYNELFDFFCRDKGFEHRQGSVYCINRLMNDYDVWKLSSELQKKCPWLVSALKRMDVTNIGVTHEITHWITESAESGKKTECVSKIFEKDLIDNGFKPSENIMQNYQRLVEDRNEVIALEDICSEYHSKSTDGLINAIGDELRIQELQHIEEAEAEPEL